MSIKSFLKLVEIQTKVASVLPFLAGVLYTYYRYATFRPLLLVLFFICMICIDMATTSINNYFDYKRAIKQSGYNYEQHNAIVKDALTIKQVLITIFILLTLASIFGFILFLFTDIVVLLLGVFAFTIGILYSFGPIPISRTPLGELFSGLTMGGLIFFVTSYIQIYNFGFINLFIDHWVLSINLNLSELIVLGVISIPFICFIGDIMLANNICDMADDIENKRYTLPYYIGKDRAIFLFNTLIMVSYISLIVSVIVGWLPILSLLTCLTLPLIVKNMKKFSAKQVKAVTFVTSVQNFIIFSLGFILALALNSLLHWVF